MDKTIEARFEDFRLKGDTHALADVFDATAPVLGRVAGHLASTQALAEDLLQETYLAAIESADRYDPQRALLPWLLGLMSNHARRAHRQSRRRPDPDRLSTQGPKPPEDEVMADELQRSVAEAISTMPEPYREVLTLHIQEEQPPSRVAQRLGRSGSTIRTQIQRGLDLLRKGIPAGLAPAVLPPLALDQVRLAVLQGATARHAGSGFLVGIKGALAVLAVALLGVGAWQYGWATGKTLSHGELDVSVLNSIDEVASVPGSRRGQSEKPEPSGRVPIDPTATVVSSVELGDMEFFPVEVPDGPLLFSIGYAPGTGTKEKIHYVQDPARRSKPQVFLRCSHNARIKHRIDHDRILLKNHGDPYGLMVVDLRTAQVTQLQEKTNNELLEVVGGKVLFQVNVVPKGYGFRMETPPAQIGDSYFWSFDPASGKPARRVFESPVRKHWKMRDGSVVAMTSLGSTGYPGRSSFWRIVPDGGTHRKLLDLDLAAMPARASLSPGGTRLALAFDPWSTPVGEPDPRKPTAARSGFHPRGHCLCIYDLTTKKRIQEVDDIQCQVSMASSSLPNLEFVWLDDRRIRFSESWSPETKGTEAKPAFDPSLNPRFRFVDIDVDTAERLAETPYSMGGLRHSVPPVGPVADPDAGKRHTYGLFEIEGSKVYYRGAHQPLIDTKGAWQWPRFSPDRRFVLATRSKPRWQAAIFDGETRTEERITDWRTEFVWLPAIR